MINQEKIITETLRSIEIKNLKITKKLEDFLNYEAISFMLTQDYFCDNLQSTRLYQGDLHTFLEDFEEMDEDEQESFKEILPELISLNNLLRLNNIDYIQF